FAQNRGTSLSASTSVSVVPSREHSWPPYISLGSTAIARLAGNVHGVVVQLAMLALSFHSPLAIGNFTYTAASSRSWYSTSASASAVCAPVLQKTGFLAR